MEKSPLLFDSAVTWVVSVIFAANPASDDEIA